MSRGPSTSPGHSLRSWLGCAQDDKGLRGSGGAGSKGRYSAVIDKFVGEDRVVAPGLESYSFTFPSAEALGYARSPLRGWFGALSRVNLRLSVAPRFVDVHLIPLVTLLILPAGGEFLSCYAAL